MPFNRSLQERFAFGRTIKTLAAAGGFGVLSACASLPQGLSQGDLAIYETAVASIGCVMYGESDYLPVEFQTGFTREQVIGLTQYELATERAVQLPDGGVELMIGACA